ncbi:Abi family protein [Limnohabitans sp.]|nr:Abi family protein [Limnohabitans sp.]
MGFAKPALTNLQQIELLRRRGMHMADAERAQQCLQHINYYRLRAYWLPFESTQVQANGEHRFLPGSDFDDVVAVYNFDRELRILILDAIERLEISLRTRLANELSLRHGPFVHEDASHFARGHVWQQSLQELQKEYQRSRETFAEHYRRQYPYLTSPPLWVACELMTLGHLSRWLQNMASPKERQAVATAYGLDEKVLVSFAHHLTVVRNIRNLILAYPQIDTRQMGFPVAWRTFSVWHEGTTP